MQDLQYKMMTTSTHAYQLDTNRTQYVSGTININLYIQRSNGTTSWQSAAQNITAVSVLREQMWLQQWETGVPCAAL